jgi:hypothetical protein
MSALRTFEKIFGPYPYTELEVAESPLIGGAGGVEFPGLITIASMIYANAQGIDRTVDSSTQDKRDHSFNIA